MTKVQEIKARIKITREEMKRKGIRRISCFNGGLIGEVYALNARLFALESELKDAIAAVAADARLSGLPALSLICECGHHLAYHAPGAGECREGAGVEQPRCKCQKFEQPLLDRKESQ